MLTKSATHLARLASEKGKPLIYIEYIEIAPWNWPIPEIGQSGRFRYVGSLLFSRAVEQSFDEGFHGRIGLHSLPQAEGFYAGIGLAALGRDPTHQNLQYFELSSEQARTILKKGGSS